MIKKSLNKRLNLPLLYENLIGLLVGQSCLSRQGSLSSRYDTSTSRNSSQVSFKTIQAFYLKVTGYPNMYICQPEIDFFW